MLSASNIIKPVPEPLKKLQNTSVCAHISEVHDTKLSKARNDLTANLVGNVQLGQGHVRRAEHGVLAGRHGGGSGRQDWGYGVLVPGFDGGEVCEMVVDGARAASNVNACAMMRRTDAAP